MRRIWNIAALGLGLTCAATPWQGAFAQPKAGATAAGAAAPASAPSSTAASAPASTAASAPASTAASAPSSTAASAANTPPPPPRRTALVQTMGQLRLETQAEGAQVLLDGEAVGVSPLPGPWTVPPGRHRIEIKPKTGAPASAEVMVSAGSLHQVPLLNGSAKPRPSGEGESPTDAEPARKVVHTGAGFSLRKAGYITAGVGVAAGIGGAVLGLLADGKASDARDLKTSDAGNSRADQAELANSAETMAFGANVLYGLAGVGLASGALMLLLGRDGLLSGPVTITPTLTPTTGGVGLGGAF